MAWPSKKMAYDLKLQTLTKILEGEFVNQKRLGAILLIITLFSLTTAAANFEFKFPNSKRKIIFNFGPVAGPDSVVLIDENQHEHVLTEGVITALTTSTNRPDLNNTDSQFNVASRAIVHKKLFGCDLPMAIVNGNPYLFDSNGVVFPIPPTTEKAWLPEVATKDVPMEDGSSLKIIAKTIKTANQPGVETQITVIDYPHGTYITKTLKISNGRRRLQDMNVRGIPDASGKTTGVVLVDSTNQVIINDITGKAMDPILANDMRLYPHDVDLGSKIKDSDLKNLNPVALESAKKAELISIRRWLENSIVGQPEVVDRFYKMVLKRYMYGQNMTKPEQATLMGPPGTGKDTSVHAYVDAINNEESAWQNNNHMFEMPVVKSDANLWTLQGSSTGHIGSEVLPPFISFLIKHSGGKYEEVIERDPTNKITKSYVQLNKEWKEGQVLEGYFPPSKGVIFVNESQHWSKKAKDQFLKKALEGSVTINSPGMGENVISVPVTWILATNEGENLVIPRKSNGQSATTKPLNIDQAFRNWKAAHDDEARLDEEMRKTNGLANSGRSEDAEGNSEAFISRQTNKILFRPLFPDSLQLIAQKKLEILKKKWAESYELTWNNDLVTTIQEFMYNAEKNGRPIEDKVEKMVEIPLLDAVNDGHLTKGSKRTLALSFKKNSDNTLSLITEGNGIDLSIPIVYSEKEKLVPIKTDEELEKTIDLPRRMKKHVFGQNGVADALGKTVLVSDEASAANSTPENATESAHNVMFLGPTSVGKTEMAKALGLEHLGSRDDVKTYDFGQVTNKEHMKEKILGSRDGFNNPVASDYMMEYDTHGGHVINVLDEAANAPADALKAIYDILREPVVTTFSDGRARVMSHVWNIFTGNAGEEWYSGIPANLPFNMQMAAMQQIYESAMANPGFRRRTLERYFSSAFIARIGESNIYFFSPMTFKSIREISQLKLSEQLEDILTAKNRRTWDIKFASMDDYSKTLEMIEAEGFVVREQGASLDLFVKQTFGTGLRAFLLTNKIPNQAQVTLVKSADTDFVNYKVIVNGKDNNLNFQIAKRVKESTLAQNEEDQILTAYHEAGHELVRHVLFGDLYKPIRIEIIPGVTEINDHMIVYEGIASSSQEKKFLYTKEAVLRELAVKLAGTAAQELASHNFIHDAGKSNDTERATNLLQFAILKWGLSDIWGSESVPTDLSISQYIATFSEEKRKRFEAAMNQMLTEARMMADAALLTNMDALQPLAVELAGRGRMFTKDLEEFYSNNKSKIDMNGFANLMKSADSIKSEKDKWVDDTPVVGRPLSASLSKRAQRPQTIANIDKIVAKQKAAEIANVVLPDKIPVEVVKNPPPSTGDAGGGLASTSAQECQVKLGALRLSHKAN